jgi:endonuclease YncB( thermonuclease family)
MSVVAGVRTVNMLCHLALTLCLCAETAAAQQAAPKGTLVGIPRIVDGDTLIINGAHIRLEGD